MPKAHSASTELAPLLDGSTAGELIPELVRHCLQQLIELEVAAVLGADRHERSGDRLGYRNGYRPRLLTRADSKCVTGVLAGAVSMG
jgi:putative transposase